MSRTDSPGGSAPPRSSTAPVRRPAPSDLVLVCGLMAVAAGVGAVGLIGGGLDLGPTVTARLPADSPGLAGVALVLIVGLPMTTTAVAGIRRSPAAADLAVLAGAALVGWIAIEAAVIRTFSWLQPACLLYGAVVAALGVLARRVGTTPGRHR
jgi:hypothetical protein